jgi:electron transport complex protein RnfG
MKKSLLISITTILCAALLLFGLNFGLKNVAKSNAQQEKLTVMQTILPDSKTFTEEAYTGNDANIRAVYKAENGYVIETVTAGYAGDITMLVGVSNEGTVTGLVVREMSETFGLGANALNDHVFLSQFLNTSGDATVGTNVDAISGATVTSKAITRCVNSAVAFVTGADTESGATSWGG